MTAVVVNGNSTPSDVSDGGGKKMNAIDINIAIAEQQEGPLHVLDALEKGSPVTQEFEAEPDSGVQEAPARPVDTGDRGTDTYPDLSGLTTVKLPHNNLILEGVCTHCAHCGHELTDAVSIQRGIGPICSKRGYAEDAAEADEIQAMIDLAEFPELAEFLTTHYRPLGIRGLVNGLVRIASLNRPRGRGQKLGNAKVHSACADAVQSLGHRKLADLLRNTLVVVTVAAVEGEPGVVSVHVKKRDLPTGWFSQIDATLSQTTWMKKARHHNVVVHHPSDPTRKARSRLQGPDGKAVSNKRALWTLLCHNFSGLIVKTTDGTVKIP